MFIESFYSGPMNFFFSENSIGISFTNTIDKFFFILYVGKINHYESSL